MRQRRQKVFFYGWVLGLVSVPVLAGAQPASPWTSPATGMSFVEIVPGCFQMGGPNAEATAPGKHPAGPRPDELPRHRVCVDGFWLGSHEVTRGQWQKVMGGPPLEPEKSQMPVAEVSWETVQQFINKLDQSDSNASYRLPTEAEWEYACRAGEDSGEVDFYSQERTQALMQVAWFKKPLREDKTALPVGSLSPNAWGLYDMLGNVWEWTADEYREDGYRLHAERNPHVDRGGERRVLRGASFKSDRFETYCGIRAFGIPDDPLPTVGFRLVRVPSQEVQP